MVDPLFLDLGQPFLIALERCLDRLEQRLELLLMLFAGLVEARVGPFEEGLVRLAEQLSADFGELRRQRLLGFAQRLDLLAESLFALALRGLQRGKLLRRTAMLVAFLAHRIELHPQRFSDGFAFRLSRAIRAASRSAHPAPARPSQHMIGSASMSPSKAEQNANIRRFEVALKGNPATAANVRYGWKAAAKVCSHALFS